MGARAKAYYASLLPPPPHRLRWSTETALEVGRLWSAEEGHAPQWADCTPAEGLPSATTIYALFGGLAAYYAAMRGAAPHPCPRAPKRVRVQVRCLGVCGQWFLSHDKRRERVCPQCKGGDDWQEGGWFNGVIVENTTADVDFVD